MITNILFKFSLLYYLILEIIELRLWVDQGFLFTLIYSIPLVLMMVFGIVTFKKENINRLDLGIFLACFAVLLISIGFNNLDTFRQFSVFVLPIVFYTKMKTDISLRFLNRMYLGVFLIAVILAYVGNESINILPSFSNAVLENVKYGGGGYRVNLLRSFPNSAFFSFIIFLLNVVHGKGTWKWLLIILSGYFVLLSAQRTVYLMLIAFLVLCVFYSFNKYQFKNQKTLIAICCSVLVVMLFVDNYSMVLFNLGLGENEYFKLFFFRDIDVSNSSVGSSNISTRDIISTKHMSVFLEAPLSGANDVDYGYYVHEGRAVYMSSTTTEALITFWLAKAGIWILFLVFYLLAILKFYFVRNNLSKVTVVIIFLIGLFLYGSSFSSYGLLFTLVFVILQNRNFESSFGLVINKPNP